MREIDTDPTVLRSNRDDDTDVMIPAGPATDAMSDLLNRYVSDVLDTFVNMIIKRMFICVVILVVVTLVALVVGLASGVWIGLPIASGSLLVFSVSWLLVLDVLRKRPDPVEVGHIKLPDQRTVN